MNGVRNTLKVLKLYILLSLCYMLNELLCSVQDAFINMSRRHNTWDDNLIKLIFLRKTPNGEKPCMTNRYISQNITYIYLLQFKI